MESKIIHTQIDEYDFYEANLRWPTYWDVRAEQSARAGRIINYEDLDTLIELNEEACNGDHKECYEQNLPCAELDGIREMLEETSFGVPR